MSAYDLIEPVCLHVADGLFAALPRPLPLVKRLEKIIIFSHRGEHDNLRVMENTLQAFTMAQAAGVAGLEFDVRWTSDLVPVIFHDADLRRLYNTPKRIADFTMSRLRRDFPMIPSLEEVVTTFGKRFVFMIELKWEKFPDPKEQSIRLASVLTPLDPVRDFYLISFQPKIFKLFNRFPSGTFLPIARIRAGPFSNLSLNEMYGGLTGHYLFINNQMIDRHHESSQKIGTGFIHSRNSLFREINRGVDWIFSNHAASIQKMVNDLLGCDKLCGE